MGWQQPQCPSWPTLKLSTSGCLVYLQTRMKLDSTGKKRQGLPPRFMTVKALSMKLSPWLPTLGSSKILLFPTLFGIKEKKNGHPKRSMDCNTSRGRTLSPRNSCHSLEWPASASDEMEILTICRTTWQGVSWKPCKNWSLSMS